jgi:hypothetical protein
MMRSISRLALSSPECLAQHALHILVGVGHQHVLFGCVRAELGHHLLDALARHRLQLGDRFAQLLHLLGSQVLEDLRRLLFAKRHQQDGGVLGALVVHDASRVRRRSC